MAGKGRFQTHTVASEGAELDDNYQKMVADIEEQTQRSGWLFGRGAFDKADLQYLRDFNNSLRYKEVEIEDKEKELWERERARVEAEAAAAATAQLEALKRRSSGGSGPTATLKGGASLGTSRPSPLLLPVKVKPAGAKQQTPQARGPSSPNQGQPATCKRLKAQDGNAAPAAQSVPASTTGMQPSPFSAAAASGGSGGRLSPAPPNSAAVVQLPGSASGHNPGDPQALQGRPEQAADSAPADVENADNAGRVGSGGGEGLKSSGSLAGLLGGYGSDDDGEDDDVAGDGTAGAKGASSVDGGALTAAGQDRTPAGGAGVGASEGGKRKGEQGSASGVEKEGAVQGGYPGGVPPSSRRNTTAKLPPPVGLLSPEELLSDPRVLVEGLLATRPEPQNVQGGDAWDSEEASSESD